jgi:putative Mg2+ transporter-C (MgtC) family protein
MPLTLSWADFSARLLCTIVAGAIVGWNRGEHGHPAGLRTTLLVCLAASLAMIQANLLLDARGKPGDSFVVLDLMRLPLGILSGIGFIGAGAIIRRPPLVLGLTTAATLWFVTVIGLCFGGGQYTLGIAGTGLGYLVLSVLKRIEDRLPIEHRATLNVTVEGNIGEALAAGLAERGYHVVERAATTRGEANRRRYHYELQWRATASDAGPARLFEELATRDGVVELDWRLGAP